jgi:hypothetical protein
VGADLVPAELHYFDPFLFVMLTQMQSPGFPLMQFAMVAALSQVNLRNRKILCLSEGDM